MHLGLEQIDSELTAIYELAAKETSTSVASNNNPSTYGGSVMFTATVTSTPTNPSAGSVTFKDGATSLCTNVALSGNTATCTTSALTAGTHPITATYNPSTGFLTSTSTTLNQVVNTKQLTGSFTAASKAYDGTTAASILTRSLSGVVGADAVSLSGGSATFDNKNVGTDKTVTGTGFTLSGAAAGNYSLASSTLTTTANITNQSLNGGFTAANKVYDGTTDATILTRFVTSGLVSGDSVTVNGGTASFGNKNADTGKTVTATGFTLSGPDAANYSIGTVGTATADITPKTVTGSFTAANKVYDGATACQHHRPFPRRGARGRRRQPQRWHGELRQQERRHGQDRDRHRLHAESARMPATTAWPRRTPRRLSANISQGRADAVVRGLRQDLRRTRGCQITAVSIASGLASGDDVHTDGRHGPLRERERRRTTRRCPHRTVGFSLAGDDAANYTSDR